MMMMMQLTRLMKRRTMIKKLLLLFNNAAIANICKPAVQRWQLRYKSAVAAFRLAKEMFARTQKTGDAVLIANAEKSLKEHGDKVSEAERATIEADIKSLKETLETGDKEAIEQKLQSLTQSTMKLGEAMYANQQDQGEGDDDAGSDAHDADKDDVIDADPLTGGGRRDAVLANAPARQDGFFGVPKVIE